MAEKRREVFEYFDPNKAPEGATYLVGATRVFRQNLTGPGQVEDVIQIQPVYADSASAFRVFEQFSPQYRKSIAQLLKSAGYYRGPVTSEATVGLRESYLNAIEALSSENAQKIQAFGPEGQQQIDDVETFLKRQSKAGTGTGGPKTYIYQKEYRPEELEDTIQEVYRDLLGRGANAEEVAKYSKRLTKQAAKPENMQQQVVTRTAEGVTKQTTREGFDPEDFLIKKLAGTDEARARKVYSFYEAFDKFVGRG